jgi:hypothetical protein
VLTDPLPRGACRGPALVDLPRSNLHETRVLFMPVQQYQTFSCDQPSRHDFREADICLVSHTTYALRLASSCY